MRKRRNFRKKPKDNSVGLSVKVYNNNVDGALRVLKKNKGKFPFNPPGEPVVNWSLDDRGSKGIEWSGIPKSKYDKAVEFFMKNKLNPRG